MSTVDKADSCCPVCLEPEVEAKWFDSAGIRFECPRCGKFVVTRSDSINLKSTRLRAEWDAHHLSALIREHNTQPLPRLWLRYGMAPYCDLNTSEPLVPIEVEELLTRWPKSVPERIDRTLCNFARQTPRAGHRIVLSDPWFPLAFAYFADEANYYLTALIELGFVKRVGVDNVITPAGWKQFDELTRGKSSRENPVFVAMWFGGDE